MNVPLKTHTDPLVSIIIPTFNRAYMIRETLCSVQNQTYQNWECIVVDDASTDNTKEVVEEICKKDTRFSYNKNQKSKGAPGARNTGLELSKGEFISFFDSDDKLLPKYIENKIKYFIADAKLDLVISLSKWLDNGNKTFYTNIPTDNHPLIRFYSLYPVADIPWFTPTLIRKSFLINNNIRWDETVLVYQDIQFNLNILSKNPTFFWCKDKFDWYWMGNDGANNTGNLKHDELLITKKLIEIYWSNLQNAIVDSILKKKVSKQYHAQMIFFIDKLSRLVREENQFLQFVKIKSDFSPLSIWLLRNRIRFTRELPIGLRQRLFWKMIRMYFKLYYPPVIKKGFYLNTTNYN